MYFNTHIGNRYGVTHRSMEAHSAFNIGQGLILLNNVNGRETHHRWGYTITHTTYTFGCELLKRNWSYLGGWPRAIYMNEGLLWISCHSISLLHNNSNTKKTVPDDETVGGWIVRRWFTQLILALKLWSRARGCVLGLEDRARPSCFCIRRMKSGRRGGGFLARTISICFFWQLYMVSDVWFIFFMWLFSYDQWQWSSSRSFSCVVQRSVRFETEEDDGLDTQCEKDRSIR